MSQPLPYQSTKWKDPKTKFSKGKGYIFEMDLEYPKELHKEHNDYPLEPERLSVKEEWFSAYYQKDRLTCNNMINVEKLVPSLMNKEYVLHKRNLDLYLLLGMKLKKIHRV